MKWKEISVVTEGSCVEAVAGIFHQLGCGGVAIENLQAAKDYINSDTWDPQLVKPCSSSHQFVVVKAYFHEDREVMEDFYACLETVQGNFNNPQIRVLIDEVKNEDWEQSWKKYYNIFKVGERLVIKPSWLEYKPQDTEVIIEIDPGMAFGTGIHASTRFCLRFIDQYIKGGEYVVDAGCGSGILSIAAAKLGARSIYAMDVDNVAVKVARENIILNNLEDIIKLEEGDIIEVLSGKKADIIFANIIAEVINKLVPEAAKALAPGGYFFGSGIIDSRWAGVEKQLKDNGFVIEQVLSEADWVGVAARKV